MTRLTGGRSGACRRASASSPEFERLDVVAESPRHRLQQAALDRIVVDNEDEGGHGYPGARRCVASIARANSLTSG